MAGQPLHPTGLFRSQAVDETEKAWRFDAHTGVTNFGGSRPTWWAKSKCEFRETVYGDELYAPAWLIREKFGS